MIANKEQINFTLNWFIKQRQDRLLKILGQSLTDEYFYRVHELIHRDYSAMNIYASQLIKFNNGKI